MKAKKTIEQINKESFNKANKYGFIIFLLILFIFAVFISFFARYLINNFPYAMQFIFCFSIGIHLGLFSSKIHAFFRKKLFKYYFSKYT